MKILMVGKYFYPFIGGVEKHMQALASELVKSGHDVTVFAGDTDMDGTRLPKTGVINNIRIQRFSHVFSLMKAILKSDCDVIHYHLIRKAFVDCGIIAGTLKKKPLVFTPHCVYPPQSFLHGVIKKVYDITVGRLSLHLVDKIICLTETDKYDVINMGADPKKIVIIPNCIAFERFNVLESPDLFRQQYDIGRFLLYVGRIDWNKGLDYVIKAMPHLRELGLTLVIVGEDAGYQKKLEALIDQVGVTQSVIFTGKVSDALVLSAYAACTLFILPSFYEGLPTVVLEAMAYKKPVIATRTGGTQHVITDGVNGFLIEYGDPLTIFDAVKKVLAADLEKIGTHAREKVKTKYTWKKSAKKVEEIYQELVDLCSC